MAYYIDLSDVGLNNYRLVEPNALLNVGTLVSNGGDGGTANVGNNPILSDIVNDVWQEIVDDPTDPSINTPQIQSTITTWSPVTDDGNALTTQAVGGNNSGSLISVHASFPSVITLAQPALIDNTANNYNIFRVAVSNFNTAGNATNITFDVYLRINGGVLGTVNNSQRLLSSGIQIPNGTAKYYIDVPFVFSAAERTVIGDFASGVEIYFEQVNGGAGAASRRNRPNVESIEWYANVFDISPYPPHNQCVMV